MYKISLDHSYADFGLHAKASGAVFCSTPFWYDGDSEIGQGELGFYFTSLFKDGENTKEFHTE